MCRVARHNQVLGGEIRGAGDAATGEDPEGEGAGEPVGGGGVPELRPPCDRPCGGSRLGAADGQGDERGGGGGGDGEAGEGAGRVRGAPGEEQVLGRGLLQPGGSRPLARHASARQLRQEGRTVRGSPACERLVGRHLLSPLLQKDHCNVSLRLTVTLIFSSGLKELT
jgi:hypothetical protein